MTVQAWIILQAADASAAVALNNANVSVAPRTVANPLANALGEGTLVGLSVLPARLLNDPDFVIWVSPLSGCPIRTMDSETLFLPPPPDDA